MNRNRACGLLILLISALLFVVAGTWVERSTPLGLLDFKVLYYGAKCYTHHCDPYNISEFQRFYSQVGAERPGDPAVIRYVVTEYVYLPTTFLFTAPFTLLPWPAAHLLWTTLTCLCYFLACLLIWTVCASRAPVISALLIGFLLASSQVIFAGGNAVGIVVSLCAIAVWCFTQSRFERTGALCLAIALLIKPHDAGLVWLFFLLAGSAYRKRALQTMVLAGAMTLAALVWAWQVCPHWLQEQHANLTSISTHGGMNDPAPGSSVDRSAGMVVDLQSVLSIFWNNPQFYNLVTYAICGTLILIWAGKTMRSNRTPAATWFALAAIVPLSMLVTYHKPYDVKLLLLTIPACTILWAEDSLLGQAALLLTAGAVVCTADIPLAVFAALTDHMHPESGGILERIVAVFILRPVSVILIALTAFYLSVFLRRACAQPASRS
jgi:hypothetical protein